MDQIQILAAIGTVVSTVSILTWFISGQFARHRILLYEASEKILAKLEYHERHDDERFKQLGNDVWQLRLESVARQNNIELRTKEDT